MYHGGGQINSCRDGFKRHRKRYAGAGGQPVYIYSVVHPLYGELGTLTDTVDRNSDVLRIDARKRGYR
jgi:hypothetical protein